MELCCFLEYKVRYRYLKFRFRAILDFTLPVWSYNVVISFIGLLDSGNLGRYSLRISLISHLAAEIFDSVLGIVCDSSVLHC